MAPHDRTTLQGSNWTQGGCQIQPATSFPRIHGLGRVAGSALRGAKTGGRAQRPQWPRAAPPSSRHPAFCAITGPLRILKQALSEWMAEKGLKPEWPPDRDSPLQAVVGEPVASH